MLSRPVALPYQKAKSNEWDTFEPFSSKLVLSPLAVIPEGNLLLAFVC